MYGSFVFVMRLFLSVLTIILFSVRALAQNSNNYIQIFANTGLNFSITDATNIETDQTLNNAITIRVKSKTSNCSVYAKISSYSYPSSYVPTSSLIALDWTGDNSNKDYSLNQSAILLQPYDQLLFTQRKMPSSSNVYDFYYNLVFKSPGYSLVPGNYNFTIMFTMTQP